MKHDYSIREDELENCKTCGGAEADLPTHCPGEKMSEERRKEISDGKIDFIDGKWCILPPGCVLNHCAAGGTEQDGGHIFDRDWESADGLSNSTMCRCGVTSMSHHMMVCP